MALHIQFNILLINHRALVLQEEKNEHLILYSFSAWFECKDSYRTSCSYDYYFIIAYFMFVLKESRTISTKLWYYNYYYYYTKIIIYFEMHSCCYIAEVKRRLQSSKSLLLNTILMILIICFKLHYYLAT